MKMRRAQRSHLHDMPKLGTPEFWIYWSGFIAGLIEAHKVKP